MFSSGSPALTTRIKTSSEDRIRIGMATTRRLTMKRNIDAPRAQRPPVGSHFQSDRPRGRAADLPGPVSLLLGRRFSPVRPSGDGQEAAHLLSFQVIPNCVGLYTTLPTLLLYATRSGNWKSGTVPRSPQMSLSAWFAAVATLAALVS